MLGFDWSIDILILNIIASNITSNIALFRKVELWKNEPIKRWEMARRLTSLRSSDFIGRAVNAAYLA